MESIIWCRPWGAGTHGRGEIGRAGHDFDAAADAVVAVAEQDVLAVVTMPWRPEEHRRETAMATESIGSPAWMAATRAT